MGILKKKGTNMYTTAPQKKAVLAERGGSRKVTMAKDGTKPKKEVTAKDLFGGNKNVSVPDTWGGREPEPSSDSIKRIDNLNNEDSLPMVFDDDTMQEVKTARSRGDEKVEIDGKQVSTLLPFMDKGEQLKKTGTTDDILTGAEGAFGTWFTPKKWRQNFAEKVVPRGYDRLPEVYDAAVHGKDMKGIEPFQSSWGSGDNKAREDAKRLYAGMGQIHDTYKISQHQPGKGGSDKTYYTYNNRDQLVKGLLGQYQNVLKHKQAGKEVPDGLLNEAKAFFGMDHDTKKVGAGALQSGYLLPGAEVNSGGNVVVDMGEDDNGKFMSFYDKNDYRIAGDASPDIGGNAFDIYDRVYYKENPDGTVSPVGEGDNKNYKTKGNRPNKFSSTRPTWDMLKDRTGAGNVFKGEDDQITDLENKIDAVKESGSATGDLINNVSDIFNLDSAKEGVSNIVDKVKDSVTQSDGKYEVVNGKFFYTPKGGTRKQMKSKQSIDAMKGVLGMRKGGRGLLY